jgi:putative oxidoreductase
MLRIALGIIMLPHGAQHALGWFGGYGFSGTLNWMTQDLGFPAPLAALAIVTELLAPIALILGVGSRAAALGVAGIMLGATKTHAANGFFMNWFGSLPAGAEGFEYHLFVLAVAIVVAIQGSGALSVDRWLSTKPPRLSAHAVTTLGLFALALLVTACNDDQVDGPVSETQRFNDGSSITSFNKTLTMDDFGAAGAIAGVGDFVFNSRDLRPANRT